MADSVQTGGLSANPSHALARPAVTAKKPAPQPVKHHARDARPKAEATPLARRALQTILALLFCVFLAAPQPANAQGAVAQSGPITQLHIGSWFGNGVLGDGGSPGAPYINALGLYGGVNCPFGISSATTPGIATGQYATFSICQSNTQTSFNIAGNGGLATPAVVFNIGGTAYTFPFSGPAGPTGPTGATGPQGPAGPGATTAVGYQLGTISHLATTAALPANTYNNGASGAGATLTATANGALTVDGTAAATGDTILVKNEAATSRNGIYIATTPGDMTHQYVLTRAAWFNGSNSLPATAVFGVSEASIANGGTRWLWTNPGAVTFGTTAITFTQFTSPPLYIDSGQNLALAGWGYAGNGKLQYNGGFQVQAPPQDYAAVFQTSTSGTVQYGVRIDTSNSVAADIPFWIYDHSAIKTLFQVAGDGTVTQSGKFVNPLLLNVAAVLNTNDQLSLHTAVNGTAGVTIENTSTGTSNQTGIYFQNDGGARIAYMSLNGNASTAAGGANAMVLVNSAANGLVSGGKFRWYDSGLATLGMTFTGAGGLQVGAAPTGGDKGAGSINVSGNIYQNNAAYTNPDYVFEQAFTGQIQRYAGKPGAASYHRLSIEEMEDYARVNWHLPGLGQDSGVGLFDGGDQVLANLESAYLDIFRLEDEHRSDQAAIAALTARLESLEARLH